LLSGGVWAAVGRAISVPCFLLFNVWLVRGLSQREYAVYAVTLTVVAFLSVAMTLGLPPTMVRVLRESLTHNANERIRASLRYCFAWVGLACLFVPLGYFALTPWYGAELAPDLRRYAPWIVAWIGLAGLSQLTGEVFRGFENFRWSAFLSGQNGGMISNVGVLTIVVFVSFLRPLDLRFVFAAHIVAVSIPLAAGLWVLFQTYQRLGRPLRNDVQADAELPPITAPGLMQQSAPLMVTRTFAVCLTHVDVFLLSGLAPSEEVAIYGAIRRLMALVAAPILLVNVVLPSFVADLYAQHRKGDMERLLRSTATLAGIPALLALFLIIAFPVPILGTLFGPEYAPGSTALVILASANVVFVLCGSSDLALMMSGRQGKLLRVSLATGVTYLLVSPWFIAEYGMYGAATASAVLIIAHNVLAMASVKRYVGVWSAASASPTLLRSTLRVLWRGALEAYRGWRAPTTRSPG
jgi:O-antigen/teichoic acid export membrane protein